MFTVWSLSVLEYLKSNKEWLFSGIGVFALSLIIAYVRFLYLRRLPRVAVQGHERISPPASNTSAMGLTANQSAQHALPAISPLPFNTSATELTANQSTQHAPGAERVSAIAIKEITSAIKNAPPLQREFVAKHYEGILVQWHARLFTARRRDNDVVQLALDFPDGSNDLVWCDVHRSDYPELSVLLKGAPITVVGRIEEASSAGVELANVNLTIHSRDAGGIS